MIASHEISQQNRESLELSEWSKRERRDDKYKWSDKDDDLIEPLRKFDIDIIPTSNGIHLGTGRYVGHLAFKHFDLLVWPKFDDLKKVNNNSSKSDLVKLLRYVFDWKRLQRFEHRDARKVFLADILVNELLEEARIIQRRGPFQQYLKHRRDLSDLRGRIDMTAIFRRGDAPSVTLPCVYHQRSLDNIMNRTLCAGLRRGGERLRFGGELWGCM